MNLSHVLIISDGAEFVREIVRCWRSDSGSPLLTVVSPRLSERTASMHCSIVVVGPLRDGTPILPGIALPLDSSVCAVVERDLLHSVRESHPDWLVIPQQPGWTDALMTLARETVRRAAAELRAAETEKVEVAQRPMAVLGEAVLDLRPSLVNALTSLLGNADLMLLSDEPMSAEAFEQTRTIHAMALRLSEILQRLFASIGETPRNEEQFDRNTHENIVQGHVRSDPMSSHDEYKPMSLP